jgi:hypothetical protein
VPAAVLLVIVSDLVLTLILVVFLPVMVLTSAGTWARFSLRRANRVAPGRSAATAPIPWLWSPGIAATLHRRLRSACHLAGSVVSSHPQPARRRWRKQGTPPPSDTIVDLAREVVEEAVQLDRELVTTSWLARGIPKAQALAALGYRVSAVEDAARRVHQLDTNRARIANPPGPAGLTLDERIAVMEAAFGELSARPPASLAGPARTTEPVTSAEAKPLTRPA